MTIRAVLSTGTHSPGSIISDFLCYSPCLFLAPVQPVFWPLHCSLDLLSLRCSKACLLRNPMPVTVLECWSTNLLPVFGFFLSTYEHRTLVYINTHTHLYNVKANANIYLHLFISHVIYRWAETTA